MLVGQPLGEQLKLHCKISSYNMPRQNWVKTDGTFPSQYKEENKGM